jgi:3-hydroxy acid dehydrogenase/malonic semialdehyde reductase
MNMKDKWVLITGASSGFGAASAQLFAKDGARLLLGARRMERLKDVAAMGVKSGAREAHFHPLDVSKTSSVEEFVKWGRNLMKDGNSDPKLDVLLNNAGGAQGMDSVAQSKDEDWETMIQTNVLGVLRMTRACLPFMVKNPGSAIINIGSYAARIAYAGGAAYCGAKAAELQITRSLRMELCGTGVRVCTVDPGLAETEFSLVRFKGDQAKAKKPYEGVQPLTAEDVAEVIFWVASRPAHVNIDELLVKPTDQAAMHLVHRRSSKD